MIGQLNINKLKQKNVQSLEENLNKKIQKSNLHTRQQTLEMSRSVSLNDLITAANELIFKEKISKKKLNNSNTSIDKLDKKSAKSIYPRQSNIKISNEIKESIEKYRDKIEPVERLELDIVPSYIRYTNNKLLVASSNAQIRIYDLKTNKIEKDEIKNVLITSICMPLIKNNEILFAITNGEVKQDNDEQNLSNSVIIVTKNELKVLKKDNDLNSNDDYNFLNPCGICFDKFNNLYICDSGNNRIKVLDLNLILVETIETATNLNDYLNQPKSLCICNEKSILFVCDSGNHRILSFDILNNGKKFLFKSVYGYGYGEDYGKMRFPLDCSVDMLGFLVIRDHHNNRIQIFSPNTMLIHTIEFNSENETIYSLTAGQNGNIYVAKMAYLQEVNSTTNQYANIIKYFIDIY